MSKTSLVVDDCDCLRQLVIITLKGAGYEVIEACDGQDGLTKLKDQKINLIISDVNMPKMDGFSFVKELKKLPNYTFTPVIMMTTESQVDKEAGQGAGTAAWVMKPFQPPQLLTAVQKLLLVNETGRRHEPD